MHRPFNELKTLLFNLGITQMELSKWMGKSLTYLSHRFTGGQPWGMDDVYFICDRLEIPYDQIALYFPKGGYPVEATS